MESIYIHEDRYNLITILPYNENISIPENGMIEISDFGIFKNLSIESKKLKITDFKENIKKYNSCEIDNIYFGYSTSFEIKKNTIAYIFDRIAVFFESNDGIIRNIWIDTIADASNISITNLFSFLFYIGKTYNLILIDYECDYLIDLSKMESIKTYFKEIFGLQ